MSNYLENRRLIEKATAEAVAKATVDASASIATLRADLVREVAARRDVEAKLAGALTELAQLKGTPAAKAIADRDALAAQVEAEAVRRKEDVLRKHMDRGALVPAQLKTAKALAVMMDADALDAHLATWPVILHRTAQGSSVSMPSAPLDALRAIAADMRAKDPTLSEAAAFTKACESNKDLYRAYRIANPIGLHVRKEGAT